MVYDAAAREAFGASAVLNFPDEADAIAGTQQNSPLFHFAPPHPADMEITSLCLACLGVGASFKDEA